MLVTAHSISGVVDELLKTADKEYEVMKPFLVFELLNMAMPLDLESFAESHDELLRVCEDKLPTYFDHRDAPGTVTSIKSILGCNMEGAACMILFFSTIRQPDGDGLSA